MPLKSTLLALLALAGPSLSCADHGHAEAVPEHEREELLRKWDQEVCLSTHIYIYISFLLIKQFSFTGISSFAHLKPVKCLVEPDERYDIAVVGAPFDTAVSYRPGKSSTTTTIHITLQASQSND